MRKSPKHINSSLEEVFGNSLAEDHIADENQYSEFPVRWLAFTVIMLIIGSALLFFLL